MSIIVGEEWFGIEWEKGKKKVEGQKGVEGKESGKRKRTTPGIPTWSPTVVLTWPDDA